MNFSIKSLFTLDLRALALMRIAISITIITDLIIRVMDLEAHYTNRGILPVEALHNFFWNPYYFSFHTLGTSYQIELILFIINFLCAFCLLVGFRTQLFTIICWLFVLSLHNRNPMIEQAGDDFLRLILFFAIFFPWGYFYSLDSIKRGALELKSTLYTSLAGFAYLCQNAYLYFFSATLKTAPEWREDYTAIYYALSLDQILTPIGKFMYQFDGLLKFLTASVFYVEYFLPLILFIPFFTHYFRTIFIIAITLLHVGINLSLNVGLFSLICIVSLLGLLPKEILDKIENSKIKLFDTLKSIIRRIGNVLGKINYSVRNKVPKENIATSLFITFILVYITLWNIQNTGREVLPKSTHWVAHLLRVDQYWGMFAPAVFKDDGWFVLVGKNKNGNEVDIHNNTRRIDFSKPEYAADFYKNDRWRKYHEKLLLVMNSHLRPYYCNYLLWNWNKENPSNPIHHLDIVFMKEVTKPDYEKVTPKKEVLCYCNL